jgi:hypothetical protein
MSSHRSKFVGASAVVLCGFGMAAACASNAPPTDTGDGQSGATASGGFGQFGPGGSNGLSGSVGAGEEFGGGAGGGGGSSGSAGSQPTGSGGVITQPGRDASVYKDPTGSVDLCPNATPLNIDTSMFSPCSIIGCHDAHCVPASLIQAVDPGAVKLLASCDSSSLCVPDDYVTTGAKFLAKACHSLLGAEGRCISTCVTQVNGLMDVLPQDVCADTERCAPCYNPNDGTDTTACEQGCDTGPSAATKADPPEFTKCGNDRGVCVQKSIVPPALVNDLPVDTCTDAGAVCAPLEKTQNLKYNFAECMPTNGFVQLLEGVGTNLPDGQLGGCVPSFLVSGNLIEALFIIQGTCPSGDVCAPCFNPLDSNKTTGACPVSLPSDDSGGLPPAPSSDAGSPPPPTNTGGAAGAP